FIQVFFLRRGTLPADAADRPMGYLDDASKARTKSIPAGRVRHRVRDKPLRTVAWRRLHPGFRVSPARLQRRACRAAVLRGHRIGSGVESREGPGIHRRAAEK